jgi:hypothetical protein
LKGRGENKGDECNVRIDKQKVIGVSEVQDTRLSNPAHSQQANSVSAQEKKVELTRTKKVPATILPGIPAQLLSLQSF